jgi:hypothetical protein
MFAGAVGLTGQSPLAIRERWSDDSLLLAINREEAVKIDEKNV